MQQLTTIPRVSLKIARLRPTPSCGQPLAREHYQGPLLPSSQAKRLIISPLTLYTAPVSCAIAPVLLSSPPVRHLSRSTFLSSELTPNCLITSQLGTIASAQSPKFKYMQPTWPITCTLDKPYWSERQTRPRKIRSTKILTETACTADSVPRRRPAYLMTSSSFSARLPMTKYLRNVSCC